MTTECQHDLIDEGQQDYEDWARSLIDTPEKRACYERIADKSDLWLQRAETHDPARTSRSARRVGRQE
jgi:hypothetical protein